MRISAKQEFLVLRNESTAPQFSVALYDTLTAVIANWSAGARVSPVWPIGAVGKRPITFRGKHRIIFLCLVSPARVFEELDLRNVRNSMDIWSSFGMFNLVLRLRTDNQGVRACRKIQDWAKKHNTPIEIWDLANGKFARGVAAPLPSIEIGNELQKLSEIARIRTPNSLRIHAQEFVALMASALSRSAQVDSRTHARLVRVTNAVCDDLKVSLQNTKETLDVTAQLTCLNAAISRFSSQTFSGISPIVSTECHFWIHSLLGTGSANVGLANFVDFVSERLGEARLPQRFLALKGITDGLPDDKALFQDPGFIWKDFLSKVKLSKECSQEPIQPIVSYYSGRDGYSSQVQTLSAPLTTLAQANSFHTNILTVTHELSHVLVEGILGYLYPDPARSARSGANSEIGNFTSFVVEERPVASMFDAARRLLAEAVIGTEQLHNHPIDNTQLTEDELLEMLKKWRREAKEVMVHTFDFLYFFRDDPKRYVEAIWKTWEAIPAISERIPEYLLRTLCAISPPLLKGNTSSRRTLAKAGVERVLQALAREGGSSTEYASMALDYLSSYWDIEKNGQPSLSKRYDNWLPLVRLTTAFMYSETIGARLFSDPKVKVGKRQCIYDGQLIGNPITFIRSTLSASPSETESLWLLHNLALNMSR